MQPFDEPVTGPAEPSAVPLAQEARPETDRLAPRGRHARRPPEPPAAPAPAAAAPAAPAPEAAPARQPAPAWVPSGQDTWTPHLLASQPQPQPQAQPEREPEPEPVVVSQPAAPTHLQPEAFASTSLEGPTYADLPKVTDAPQVSPNLLSRVLVIGLIVVALLVAAGVALVWGDDAQRGAARRAAVQTNAATRDPAVGRRTAVTQLLKARGEAVRNKDKAAFLAQIDPTAEEFRAQQSELFDRLAKLPFADWSYQLAGEGPGLPADRALQLPRGSAIARVRLSYRFVDSDSPVEREQYLTVVPRGGHWLLAGNDDATSAGMQTEQDIWDLGPVQVVRGKSSLVLGDASSKELTRLAAEADRGVQDVGGVWRAKWSRHPVVVFPKSQDDMATLIGSDGKGLSQIAAVTTGSFESGLSRGDRIVVNPAAWRTLGTLGRRVVLAHEMTHLATRAITVQPVPIWLSEGFADYVAYRAVKVPTNVVAGDVLDDVKKGKGPTALPDDKAFDAARGDIAAAYEGAWLACRMIAEKYGQPKLIQLYLSLADNKSAPPGGDIKATLGISEQTLVTQWLDYLSSRAKA